MHLVADTIRSLDESARAVDLGQTAGEVAFLSFSDSDLGLVAAVHGGRGDLPSLRIASLADLRHPYSVDLWLDAVGRRARFVLVRLLGGLDYWRYGVDELANAARARGFDLAIVPGDARDDERLDRASTLPVEELRRLWTWFQEGGPENIGSALGWIAERLGHAATWDEPRPLPAHGAFPAACRAGDGPTALITFYRSFVTAADTAPIVGLADALAARGFGVHAEYVTSLKDGRVVAGLSRLIDELVPAIVINTTAFSARLDDGTSVLERAGVPILQAVLATSERPAWEASTRGLGSADLAMNVVLPEIDGRIATRAISFKGREARSEQHQFARAVHVADTDGIAHVADLARAWVDLAATPRADRRLGLVVSDYPAKGGRTAYAVGLDTPASLVAILEDLRAAGYDVAQAPSADAVMRALEGRSAVDGADGEIAAGAPSDLSLPSPPSLSLPLRGGGNEVAMAVETRASVVAAGMAEGPTSSGVGLDSTAPAAPGALFPSPLAGEGGPQGRMRGHGPTSVSAAVEGTTVPSSRPEGMTGPAPSSALRAPSPARGEGGAWGEVAGYSGASADAGGREIAGGPADRPPSPPSLSLPLQGGGNEVAMAGETPASAVAAWSVGLTSPAADLSFPLSDAVAKDLSPRVPSPPEGEGQGEGAGRGPELTNSAGQAFASVWTAQASIDRATTARAIPSPLVGEGQGGGYGRPSEDATPATNDPRKAALPLPAYRAALARLPAAFREAVTATWGDPAEDADVVDGAFRFATLDLGKITIAVQPDRGRRAERKTEYHDTAIPPRHGYVAFYVLMREILRIDAMIHLGTHGTLEWLPGKAAAPSSVCAPTAVLGAVPVIYPFVVNNPGEAAQAKRRISAVTVGHTTPPLTRAGSHGAAAAIEALLDEFSQAQTLDARRAQMLATAILDEARETGLAAESGIRDGMDAAEALTKLDAWLCDLKDARIGDGLHVFARPSSPALREAAIEALSEGQTPEAVADLGERLAACAEAERRGLIAALDGRFVAPGPAGAPSRGRLDVLPTGRNLYAVDPRGVPTRTAWEIGKRTADEVIAAYVQDHGEWPQRIVLDLWGSATMRTGGDDLAQAFALMGVRPVWDTATARVSGYEIQVPARLGRPRVDVTLRVSGLFRDVFPAQIALFDEAVRAVAALDEPDEDNPLAAARRAGATARDDAYRIFGTAPGAYGVGLSTTIATGAWDSRGELGAQYLAASGHAYGRDAEGVAAHDAFAARVGSADAFVHSQDTVEQDVLDSDAYSEHEGGFAAAAASLGNAPALYHADTTTISRSKVRTLAQEIQRVVRSRATNPRWLDGQMRHGHRGAAEIAETVGNLLGFAATTDAVAQTAFDLVFDATLGDDRVRDFMIEANPRAAEATARAFDEAIRRGLWTTRRNSVAGRIAETLETGR